MPWHACRADDCNNCFRISKKGLTGLVSVRLSARLIAFRQALVLHAPLNTAPETLMAINKRKRKLAAKAEAAGGAVQPAPLRVRKCTVDNRVEQLHEQAIAQDMRYTAVKEKLEEAVQQGHELRQQLEEAKGQLAAKQQEIRKLRWKLLTNGGPPPEVEANYQKQLEEMREQLAEAKEDAENAWRLNTSSEREIRRVKAKMGKQLEAAVVESRERGLQVESLHATLKDLREDHASLQRSITASASIPVRGRAFRQTDGEVSREAQRKENQRLKEALEDFLNMELGSGGGASGELAKTMMVGFFSQYTNMLEHILTEMQVYEAAERRTVEAIQEKWSQDVCTAIFVHGDMTYAGYQALINLTSKTYCFNTDTFLPVQLPYGSEMPKLRSKNMLRAHLQEISEMHGLKTMEGGRAAAVDIKKLLQLRLSHIRKHAPEQASLPATIKVRLIALIIPSQATTNVPDEQIC